MATHSSILAWRIPMDRGARPQGRKESDMTERQSTARVKFHPGFMILELLFEQNNSIGLG